MGGSWLQHFIYIFELLQENFHMQNALFVVRRDIFRGPVQIILKDSMLMVRTVV